jgi:hypothetical protein
MRFGDIQSRYNALQQIMNCVIIGQKYIYDYTTNTERPSYEVLQEAQHLFKDACNDSIQYELDIAEKHKQIHPRYALERLEKALREPFFDEIGRRKLEQKHSEISNIARSQQLAETIIDNTNQETDVLNRFQGLLKAYTVFEHTPGLQEQLSHTRHMAISVLVLEITDSLQHIKLLLDVLELETARERIKDSEIRILSWPESKMPDEIEKLSVKLRETQKQLWNTEHAWKEYNHYAQAIRERIILPYENLRATQLFDEVATDTRFQNFVDLRILKLEVQTYRKLVEQLAEATSAYNQSNWLKAIEMCDNVMKSGSVGQLAKEFSRLRDNAQLEQNIQVLYDEIFAENFKKARYLLGFILSIQDEGKKASLTIRLNSEIQFLKEKTGF